MRAIFISYRREESAGEARALYNELVERLGKDFVFMDVDSIALGQDFRDVVQEHLSSCDLVLTLVGKEWLDVKNRDGRRRLDDPNDFVRLELAAALKRKIPVTPVLLHGTRMPSPEDLPEDVRDFAYRNAFELSHSRWESDVQEMLRRLQLVDAHRQTEDTRRAIGTVRSKESPIAPSPVSPTLPAPPQKWRLGLVTLVGALFAALIVAAGAYTFWGNANVAQDQPARPSSGATQNPKTPVSPGVDDSPRVDSNTTRPPASGNLIGAVARSHAVAVSQPFQGEGSAGTIDLSSVGQLDWRQFATGDRKRGGALIGEMVASAPMTRYDNDLMRTTWSDGSPASSGSATAGIHLGGLAGEVKDPHVAFTVAANMSQRRRVTVIMSTFQSSATLSATLPNASPYTVTFTTLGQQRNYSSHLITIDFRSSHPGDVLRVRLVRNGFGNHNNASLVAAAVSNVE